MKQSSRFLILALSMAVVAGCGNSDDKAGPQVQAGQPYGQQMMPEQQQQYGQQMQQQYPQQAGQQPVIINQQAPQQDNTMSNMLLGGLIGHAIGSSGNKGDTVIRERVIERRYEAPPAAIAPAASSSYQQPVQRPQAAQVAPAQKTYAGWGSPSAKPAQVAQQPAKSYSGWGSSSSSSSKSSSSYSSKSYGRKR